jgi:hypothetical protein
MGAAALVQYDVIIFTTTASSSWWLQIILHTTFSDRACWCSGNSLYLSLGGSWMHFRLAYLTENVMAFLSHSPSKTSSVHQRSSHLIRCNITSAVETVSLNGSLLLGQKLQLQCFRWQLTWSLVRIPDEVRVSVKLTTNIHLVLRSRIRGAIPPLHQYALMAWCSVKNKAQGQLYLYL